jgi:leucyl-tRNA synthetase
MSESWANRDAIKKIEDEMRDKSNFEVERDHTKPKFFCTFPYAYMNGTLHLGHAYTFGKVETMARYYRLNGAQVLLPFGYHGTGMPIVACANKLRYELETYSEDQYDSLDDKKQIKILLNMKVDRAEISKFVDPYYWIHYFPKKAREDIEIFGGSIDFRRSFITTDVNPYYDSFVTWQFNKLIKKGLLKFGKRYSIYSVKDGQPCADHDRSEGENIDYVEYFLNFKEYTDSEFGVFYVPFVVSETYEIGKNEKLFFHQKLKYVLFEYKGNKYVICEYALKNLKYQLIDSEIKVINDNYDMSNQGLHKMNKELIKSKDNDLVDELCPASTGFYMGSGKGKIGKSDESSDNFRYFEPENVIVSRSKDICIVALVDQWFINYGDEELKKKVNKFLDEDFKADPIVLNLLKIASNWIKEWPCSRSQGLGTKIPGTDLLIDSLSDSTIYMAYYTVAHLLEKIPISEFSDILWDYIFLGIDNDSFGSEIKPILDEMRAEFEYWYPLDLRVSGKDLVPNHLTMCIYNHMAIWDDPKKCPRSYLINGYLLLDGKKMSKSDGNFMTLREAVEKYGADPVRLTLSEGEGMDDGDFRTKHAEANIMRLTNEREWIMEILREISEFMSDDKLPNIWEKIFNAEVDRAVEIVHEEYKNGKFRNAIREGFYGLLSIRDKYRDLCQRKIITMNYRLMKKIIENILLSIYPVCPHFVTHIWENSVIKLATSWTEIEKHDKCEPSSSSKSSINRYLYCGNYIRKIIDDINSVNHRYIKKKKNISDIEIQIVKKYSDTELKIMDFFGNEFMKDPSITADRKSWMEFMGKFTMDIPSSEKANYASYMHFVKESVDVYGIEWIEFSKDYETIHIFLQEYLRKILQIPVEVNIVFTLHDTIKEFKFNPSVPNIVIT